MNWYAVTGEGAVARGWYGTADRLLEGEPEGAGHARMALARANVGGGDTAMDEAQHAIEIARRIGDREIEMSALHLQGRVMVQRGNLEQGTPLLDEAMTAAVGGHSR